ncbi:MAG: hypothetical protein HC888_03745 [Candidatus Competibacteraceae bacterium]|nr:hypothetical protein [Candidatus Competibacteraceae bacterium]
MMNYGAVVYPKIDWVGATTAGHVCELRNGAFGADDIFFRATATGANDDKQDYFDGLRVNELRLQTLGSGVVLITVM